MELESPMMSTEDLQQLVGKPKHHPKSKGMLPAPVTVTGVSFVSTLWLISTFLLLSGLVVAGGFPNWIVNRVEAGPQARELNTAISSVELGLYYLRYNLTACNTQSECTDTCKELKYCDTVPYLLYDPPSSFVSGNTNFTTNLQKTESLGDLAFLFSASILYAFGIGLLLVSLFVGVCAYCKPRIRSCSVFLVAFVLQVFSGVILIVALALIPVFFGSSFAEQFCGPGADFYQRGQCSIDWSLFLAMVVTACTLYLPALAVFSMNISDGLKGHVCC